MLLNIYFAPYDERASSDTGVMTKTESDTHTKEAIQSPWKLILYNDEIHTFDEVIGQLMKAVGCSHTRAEEITNKVHNEGKALVYEGNFEECLRIDSVLKEIQLLTEIKG